MNPTSVIVSQLCEVLHFHDVTICYVVIITLRVELLV